jgi:hypothetical protein
MGEDIGPFLVPVALLTSTTIPIFLKFLELLVRAIKILNIFFINRLTRTLDSDS